MRPIMEGYKYGPMSKKYVAGSVTALIGLAVMILGGALFYMAGSVGSPTVMLIGVAITVPGALLAVWSHPGTIKTESGEK